MCYGQSGDNCSPLPEVVVELAFAAWRMEFDASGIASGNASGIETAATDADMIGLASAASRMESAVSRIACLENAARDTDITGLASAASWLVPQEVR